THDECRNFQIEYERTNVAKEWTSTETEISGSSELEQDAVNSGADDHQPSVVKLKHETTVAPPKTATRAASSSECLLSPSSKIVLDESNRDRGTEIMKEISDLKMMISKVYAIQKRSNRKELTYSLTPSIQFSDDEDSGQLSDIEVIDGYSTSSSSVDSDEDEQMLNELLYNVKYDSDNRPVHEYTQYSVSELSIELLNFFRASRLPENLRKQLLKLVSKYMPVPNNILLSTSEILCSAGLQKFYSNDRLCCFCFEKVVSGKCVNTSCKHSNEKLLSDESVNFIQFDMEFQVKVLCEQNILLLKRYQSGGEGFKGVYSHDGHCTTYPNDLNAEVRTHKVYDRYANSAITHSHNRDETAGIKGVSAFRQVLDVPLPDAIEIDGMYTVFLCHGKKLMKLIQSSMTKEDINRVSQKLRHLLYIHDIQRRPRGFDAVHKWKASEVRVFIFYIGLPLLCTAAPEEIVGDFAMYVVIQRLLHDNWVKDPNRARALSSLIKLYIENLND
ncbi:unnamed protein product, partial [Didymodactylos carnosus]